MSSSYEPIISVHHSNIQVGNQRGPKPPYGARLRTDFPWPKWPVLAMLFNEGSGNVVHDLSGYGNHGTIYGGCSWEEGGLKFDGSSGYVNCGNDSSLDIFSTTTSKFTILFMASIDMSATNLMILYKGAAGYAVKGYGSGSWDCIEVYWNDGSTSNYSCLDSTNRFHNRNTVFAFSFDRRVHRGQWFANGVGENKKTSDGIGAITNTDNLRIGRAGSTYQKMTLQLLIIIPAALDANLIKYLSAFPYAPFEVPKH